MNTQVARTILHQLQYGKTYCGTRGGLAMICWGVRCMKYTDTGLTFRVSGAKIKGHVAIEYLAGSDLYDVKIYNTHLTLKEHVKNVYYHDLVTLIDNEIAEV